jgi:hypothetical protein
MVFSKLTVRYGRDFLSRYEGQDLAVVKANWAEEMAGLQDRPEAIKYALDHPTAKPPNVVEFIESCRRAPTRALFAIAPPSANPDVIERAMRKAQEAFRHKGDVLDPIRNLRRRELDGDKTLTRAQREFWRTALRAELGVPA